MTSVKPVDVAGFAGCVAFWLMRFPRSVRARNGACASSSVAPGPAAIRDFACGRNLRLLQPRRVSCYLPAPGLKWGVEGVMFWRGVALLIVAVLLSGCETERNGLDYSAMMQKIGPPRAGQSRIVVLREKG